MPRMKTLEINVRRRLGEPSHELENAANRIFDELRRICEELPHQCTRAEMNDVAGGYNIYVDVDSEAKEALDRVQRLYFSIQRRKRRFSEN